MEKILIKDFFKTIRVLGKEVEILVGVLFYQFGNLLIELVVLLNDPFNKFF